MKAQSVLLMRTKSTQHTSDDVKRLRAFGVQDFTVRLADSHWEHPDGSKYIPSFNDYGDDCIEQILWGAPQGIYDYIVGNEPNIDWVTPNYTEWNYRAFLTNVIIYVRGKLADLELKGKLPNRNKIRLGFPPIAIATDPKYRPYDWLRVLADVTPRFDFITAHCYYQSGRTLPDDILRGPMTWEQFGASYEWLHEHFSPKPIIVGEWGNSIHEQGKLTAQQVEAIRCADYPLWQQRAGAAGYIDASYCFISAGATNDWAGFRVTPPVARALAG